MFEGINFGDPQLMLRVLVAISVAATIFPLAMPMFERDNFATRMKSVSVERARIRAREREKLNTRQTKINLRQEPKAFMRAIVDRLNLSSWLGTEKAKLELAQAGFRGQQAEVGFLFFRFTMPIVLFVFALFYLFVLQPFDWPPLVRLGASIAAAYVGIKAPEIYLKNIMQKRRQSMRIAFPDALDLLLICVEAGMSIEHAFRKVAQEIGVQSIPLAEELSLTTAELSYLPDRKIAYENLAIRTGLDSVKQIVTALSQAERYGTPLGSALRVVAQESRDNRLMEAEKKAAALPPKLTVPMIIFFLPVLFAVILTPAIVQLIVLQK